MAFIDRYQSLMGTMGAHPDKMTINQLTMMADDVKKATVPGTKPQDLVGAIESKLLRSKPDEKLPIIFLMDSIMYNVRGDYPYLFAQKLPSLFMDTYRSGDDKVKQRLQKLLDAWQKRRHFEGPLPARTLGEIQKRINPNFNVEAFVADHERRFPPAKSPAYLASYNNPAPTSYSQPPQPQQPRFLPQPQYDELLTQKASVILNELQTEMNVPASERIDMRELYSRPDLLQQVFDSAREALYNDNIHVQPTPSPTHAMIQPPPGPPPMHAMMQPIQTSPPPQHIYGMPRTPPAIPNTPPMMPHTEQPSSEPNWSSDWLKDSSGLEPFLKQLHKGGSPDSAGLFVDAGTGLHFDTQDKLNAYKSVVAAQHQALTDAKPKAGVIVSRNWFNSADEWVQNKEQVHVVEGSGFEDDDVADIANADGATALGRQDSVGSTQSLESKYVVPVDDAFPTCPISGESFERFYDDDSGEWMYKNAIRPDPAGPIYLASAYLEHNKKRKLSQGGDEPPTKTLKTAV